MLRIDGNLELLYIYRNLWVFTLFLGFFILHIYTISTPVLKEQHGNSVLFLNPLVRCNVL